MFLLKPLQWLAKTLTDQDSPRQMAAGFALGALAGLIPKSSLLAQLILMAICVINVNLLAAAGATALFTLLSPLSDLLTHNIGYFFLVDLRFLKPFWTLLYNLPLVPWTRFNNTITLGSLILGSVLVYPIYLLMTPVFAEYKAKYADRIKRFRIVQILRGVELTQKYRG